MLMMTWRHGCCVSGADCEGDLFSKDGMRLTFSESCAELAVGVERFRPFPEGSRIAVTLWVFPEETPGKAYSQLELSDGRRSLDNAFPANIWTLSAFEAKVLRDGERPYFLLKLCGTAALTVRLRLLSVQESPLPERLFAGDRLTMLAQTNPKNGQMECLLYETEGHLIVVDGGEAEDAEHLYRKICECRPDRQVDLWLLTHYHCDHVNALTRILERYDIRIRTLCYRFPTPEELEGNGDGDNYCVAAVNDAVAAHPEKVERVLTPGRGDAYRVGRVTVEVLNDACFTPNDDFCNNSSVVYRFVTCGEKLLVLGDLASKGDDYLHDPEFRKAISECTVIQLAHHGQDGVSDRFYRSCKNIKVCLYCAPDWLYHVDNGGGYGSGIWLTLHTRRLMAELGVLRSYSCASGKDQVLL